MERELSTDAFGAMLREIARASERLPASDRPSPLTIGEHVSRFELVRELGRGGFGVVYEARDTELNRHVAVKAMRVERQGQAMIDAFKRETQAAVALNHHNIVSLYDYGVHADTPYLVLELVPGETVAHLLRAGPVALDHALSGTPDRARPRARACGGRDPSRPQARQLDADDRRARQDRRLRPRAIALRWHAGVHGATRSA